MFKLTKMSWGSEDYLLSQVYYLGKKKKRKRKKGSEDDPEGDEPDFDPDDVGFDLGDIEPYAIEMPGEPPGRWFGKGAEKLGLTGEIREDPYRRTFRGYHHKTWKPLVQNAGKRNRRPGWEASFTPPKDVSTFWSQAPPDVRERICQGAPKTGQVGAPEKRPF